MHPDDLELCREKHTQMLAGTIEEFEIHIRVKTPEDEEWQYCTVSGSVFSRNENGELLEYVGVRRNNTRYLSLLRQNDLILNNTNSGLIYLTPDYIVQWENVSARKDFLYEGAYAKSVSVLKRLAWSSLVNIVSCRVHLPAGIPNERSLNIQVKRLKFLQLLSGIRKMKSKEWY